MKTKVILILLLLQSSISFSQSNVGRQLKQLSEQHQFNKMDSLNNAIRTKDYFIYKALYANVCNNPQLSEKYLDSLQQPEVAGNFTYYKLKNDNCIKLFDYAGAFETSKILTTKFSTHFSKSELKDEINTQRIWEVLKATPAQSISPFTNISVKTKRDLVGLITTNVSANGIDTSFVFDTGAGISCITQSMAKKFGLQLLPDNNISVMSFTGIENKVLIGVAPALSIGGISIKNAVFLVYPDDAFTFAKGAYIINGIIGFPIAKELGTITIEKESLTFSKTAVDESIARNLFVDQLRAILMLTYKGKTLPYNFDSGAKESLFNKSFYELFKSEANTGKVISDRSSGAGGQEVTTELLELKDQVIYLGQTAIKLDKLQIDKKNYGVYGKADFGNIGQDIIGQFKKVTISFDHNYLKLEN
jgi:hypothetical protein